MDSQPSNPCGPDCWLKQDDPTPTERKVDDYGAAAYCAKSQLLLQPKKAARYLYNPVHPWQMRLICLQPGKFQDTLKCTLHTADLVAFEGVGISDYSKIVDYFAPSYHWGDNHVFTHPLHYGRLIVAIAANLASALHHIRLTDKPCYLWIDAICINQYDDLEKGQQVQNMFAIFKKPSLSSPD